MKSILLPQNRWQWILLAAALGIGVLLRLPGLAAPLTHDEVYTWEAFASKSYATIASFYPLPNNHILHSMLVRLATESLGRSEWTVRLPALAAGLLALPAMYLLGAVLLQSVRAGLVATWLLVLLPVHIGYSQVARGYSLLVMMAICSLFFLWQALQGQKWGWIGFVAAAFAGAYTLPSGILYWGILALWGFLLAVEQKNNKQLATVLAANLVVALLVGWAYWSIKADVVAAGAQWGVAVGDDLGALFGVVQGLGALCIGSGVWGLAPALLALGGLALLWSRLPALGWYTALVCIVPWPLGWIMGTMGPARSYLFVVPAFVLLATYGAVELFKSRRWRVVALGCLMAGYGWKGLQYLAEHEANEGLRGIGKFLAQAPAVGDIVVAPFIMDLEVWYYAKQAIQRGLVSAVLQKQSDRLLFVTDSADARFDLDNYLLHASATKNRRPTAFPLASFRSLYRVGSKSLQVFAARGSPIFADTLSWRMYKGDNQGLRLSRGAPAITHAPSWHLENPGGGEFALHSSQRVTMARDGLLVLLAPRTDERSEVSVYQVVGEVNSPRVVELHMLQTGAKAAKVAGRDGQLWRIQAFLIPVLQGRHYGVYIRGQGKQVQHFADITVFFFPFASSE